MRRPTRCKVGVGAGRGAPASHPMSDTPVSKILILDESTEHLQSLKRFCDETGLVGLKVRRSAILGVLRTNIDMGAVLLSESFTESILDTTDIALEIHSTR